MAWTDSPVIGLWPHHSWTLATVQKGLGAGGLEQVWSRGSKQSRQGTDPGGSNPEHRDQLNRDERVETVMVHEWAQDWFEDHGRL